MANKHDSHADAILALYSKGLSFADIARELGKQGLKTSSEELARWYRRRLAVMRARSREVAQLKVGDAWSAIAALIEAGQLVELEEMVMSARARRFAPSAEERAEEAHARANPVKPRLRRGERYVPSAEDLAEAMRGDESEGAEAEGPEKIGRRSPPPPPAASVSPTGGPSAEAARSGTDPAEKSGRPTPAPAAPASAGPSNKAASSGTEPTENRALDSRIGPRTPTADDEFFAKLQRQIDTDSHKGVGLLQTSPKKDPEK